MLTKKDIVKVYERAKRDALRALSRNDVEGSIRNFVFASHQAYRFNWVYEDDEFEDAVKTIGRVTVGESTVVPFSSERFMFYDSFGWDNRGLTQQYISAMISWGVEFLYVFENEDPRRSSAIRRMLEGYGRCRVVSLARDETPARRMAEIRDLFVDWRPAKVFLHLTPWAIEPLAVCASLTGVDRYQVNLTDHAFWLGSKIVDYSIEFRDYGCTVSKDMRGIDADRLLVQPYYPVTVKADFLGFPRFPFADPVVIFSGGSMYKVYGKDGAYFRIAKRILDENPNTVILYAGGGHSRPLLDFIEQNGLGDRFILIGDRSDINEVFRHCDIYLGSYPICGGLMSQYAAVNGKPILAYTSPDIPCNVIEGLVCHLNDAPVTFFSEDALAAEARRLCSDPAYRAERGREMAKGVITPEIFAEDLRALVETNRNTKPISRVDIDYEAFFNLYLEVENEYLDDFKREVYRFYGFWTIVLFPRLAMKTLPWLLRKVVAKVMRGSGR
jgi:glycosyltransferase involved in cell wall biosynthesis